jgi:hypothetical protein
MIEKESEPNKKAARPNNSMIDDLTGPNQRGEGSNRVGAGEGEMKWKGEIIVDLQHVDRGDAMTLPRPMGSWIRLLGWNLTRTIGVFAVLQGKCGRV